MFGPATPCDRSVELSLKDSLTDRQAPYILYEVTSFLSLRQSL